MIGIKDHTEIPADGGGQGGGSGGQKGSGGRGPDGGLGTGGGSGAGTGGAGGLATGTGGAGVGGGGVVGTGGMGVGGMGVGGGGGTGLGTGGVGAGTGGAGIGTGGMLGGTGGSLVGTGGRGTGGMGTGGMMPGTGGVMPGTGGGRACAPASTDVLSDFEEGSGVLIPQGNPPRTGWWSVFADTTGTVTPATTAVPTPAAASGDTNMCNKWALHMTGSNFVNSGYAGLSASYLPAAMPSPLRSPYDLSPPYTGISFRAKSGSGTLPALFVEMMTKENQPTSSGGTATTNGVDLYNMRGQIVVGIPTTWQTFYVPFGTLIPRLIPAAGTCGAVRCQAPKWVPTSALGLQFSFYNDAGFPHPAGSTQGTFDLWIDDVTLVRNDVGLPTLAGFSPADAPVGTCIKPTGPAAAGKFLVTAYNTWKQTFVVAASGGFRVQRPESSNDTVSEGIAFGMLIAVYMNDKTLFDGLWTYWKANAAVSGPLMTWKVPGGSGSATSADEDAAFALIVASHRWGGTYSDDALGVIHAILSSDMSGASYIKGGSNYGATSPTSPSYFAPAYYKAFADLDVANEGTWIALAGASYTLLGNISSASSAGLFPGWCGSNCTAVANNGNATDVFYQYDAHRLPWRIGLDNCWYGGTAGKNLLMKISAFFANSTNAGANGTARIADMYQLNGTAASGSKPNSASAIGMAGVAAMSDNTAAAFLNDAYQTTFDLLTRGPMATDGSYTYVNATVGMVSLLTMTGNFLQPGSPALP